MGKKIKARVLYELAGNPSKFALAHADHIVKLTPSTLTSEYPLGRIVQSAKIVKVEPERGVMLEMDPGVKAFAHVRHLLNRIEALGPTCLQISHLSDEHLPTIPSTSYWKSGSLHRARIIGYFHFDGIIQVSLKSSVLEKKLMRVDDVQVGQVIKGTIKSLTPSGLFVSIDGSFDAVVWPNHYADIVLKNPSKRFKPGSTIKCRVGYSVSHPSRADVIADSSCGSREKENSIDGQKVISGIGSSHRVLLGGCPSWPLDSCGCYQGPRCRCPR